MPAHGYFLSCFLQCFGPGCILETALSIPRDDFQRLSPASGCGAHLHIQPEGCHSGLWDNWLLSIPVPRSRTEIKCCEKACDPVILPPWPNPEGEMIILLSPVLTYRMWSWFHIKHCHKKRSLIGELWGVFAWLVGRLGLFLATVFCCCWTIFKLFKFRD